MHSWQLIRTIRRHTQYRRGGEKIRQQYNLMLGGRQCTSIEFHICYTKTHESQVGSLMMLAVKSDYILPHVCTVPLSQCIQCAQQRHCVCGSKRYLNQLYVCTQHAQTSQTDRQTQNQTEACFAHPTITVVKIETLKHELILP